MTLADGPHGHFDSHQYAAPGIRGLMARAARVVKTPTEDQVRAGRGVS
jgi:hypothetical protein